jgi:hypothetical protein
MTRNSSFVLALDRLPVKLEPSTVARQESRPSLFCKDNILWNKVYIFNTLVF